MPILNKVIKTFLANLIVKRVILACQTTCQYKEPTLKWFTTNQLDEVFDVEKEDLTIDYDNNSGGIMVSGQDSWSTSQCCADRTMWYISGNEAHVEAWPRFTPSDHSELPGPRMTIDFHAQPSKLDRMNMVVFTHEDEHGNIYGDTYAFLTNKEGTTPSS